MRHYHQNRFIPKYIQGGAETASGAPRVLLRLGRIDVGLRNCWCVTLSSEYFIVMVITHLLHYLSAFHHERKVFDAETILLHFTSVHLAMTEMTRFLC